MTIYLSDDTCELCSAHISNPHEPLCDYSDDQNLTIAKVAQLPKCNFCENTAQYDGKLREFGMWAYMCYSHFHEFGIGKLGTGLGQELKVTN